MSFPEFNQSARNLFANVAATIGSIWPFKSSSSSETKAAKLTEIISSQESHAPNELGHKISTDFDSSIQSSSNFPKIQITENHSLMHEMSKNSFFSETKYNELKEIADLAIRRKADVEAAGRLIKQGDWKTLLTTLKREDRGILFATMALEKETGVKPLEFMTAIMFFDVLAKLKGGDTWEICSLSNLAADFPLIINKKAYQQQQLPASHQCYLKIKVVSDEENYNLGLSGNSPYFPIDKKKGLLFVPSGPLLEGLIKKNSEQDDYQIQLIEGFTDPEKMPLDLLQNRHAFATLFDQTVKVHNQSGDDLWVYEHDALHSQFRLEYLNYKGLLEGAILMQEFKKTLPDHGVEVKFNKNNQLALDPDHVKQSFLRVFCGVILDGSIFMEECAPDLNVNDPEYFVDWLVDQGVEKIKESHKRNVGTDYDWTSLQEELKRELNDFAIRKYHPNQRLYEKERELMIGKLEQEFDDLSAEVVQRAANIALHERMRIKKIIQCIKRGEPNDWKVLAKLIGSYRGMVALNAARVVEDGITPEEFELAKTFMDHILSLDDILDEWEVVQLKLYEFNSHLQITFRDREIPANQRCYLLIKEDNAHKIILSPQLLKK